MLLRPVYLVVQAALPRSARTSALNCFKVVSSASISTRQRKDGSAPIPTAEAVRNPKSKGGKTRTRRILCTSAGSQAIIHCHHQWEATDHRCTQRPSRG